MPRPDHRHYHPAPPRPHYYPRPRYHRHHGSWLNVWLDLTGLLTSSDGRSESERRVERNEREASAAIYAVPDDPSMWGGKYSAATGEFEMWAPFYVPSGMRRDDIASVRAVFNDYVRPASVEVSLDDALTSVIISGKTVYATDVGYAELHQIVVELSDGTTGVQNISMPLKGVAAGPEV